MKKKSIPYGCATDKEPKREFLGELGSKKKVGASEKSEKDLDKYTGDLKEDYRSRLFWETRNVLASIEDLSIFSKNHLHASALLDPVQKKRFRRVREKRNLCRMSDPSIM